MTVHTVFSKSPHWIWLCSDWVTWLQLPYVTGIRIKDVRDRCRSGWARNRILAASLNAATKWVLLFLESCKQRAKKGTWIPEKLWHAFATTESAALKNKDWNLKTGWMREVLLKSHPNIFRCYIIGYWRRTRDYVETSLGLLLSCHWRWSQSGTTTRWNVETAEDAICPLFHQGWPQIF